MGLSFWKASPAVNAGDVAVQLEWLQRERVTGWSIVSSWYRSGERALPCRLPWSPQVQSWATLL